jgi:hypothetical protein
LDYIHAECYRAGEMKHGPNGLIHSGLPVVALAAGWFSGIVRRGVMQNIPISLAAAGMVIAREIKVAGDATGRVLCGKGVRLTDSLISRLRQLGIESVVVEGHPVKMEGEVTLEQMLEALDRRFSRLTNDPLMMKVKKIYRKRLIESMGEETGG